MEKQNKCPTCAKVLQNDFNFCPYCGEAISELAKETLREQTKVSQLKLINLLTDKVKDQKTLELLEKLTSMYKEN